MGRLKLPLALAVFTAAAFFAASGHWPWHRLALEPAPALSTVAPALARPVTESLDTLHRGETVAAVCARHGVDGIDLPSLSRKLSVDPRRLRAGLVFTFRHPAADSVPDAISVRTSPEQRLTFTRVADEWNAESETIAWQPEVVRIEGNIDNSLYEALDSQVPDSVLGGNERTGLAWALADVYDWQVDFTRDIQPGDHFQVVLERLVSALAAGAASTTRREIHFGSRSSARRSSSAGSRRRSRGPGSIPSSGSRGSMKEPTTPPLREHRYGRRARASWCGPAGRAGTAT